MPSVELLQQCGLWPKLDPHATALRTMRIVDAGGEENEVRDIVDFDASEIGQEVFGYNLPNTVLRDEITAAIPKASLRHSTSLTHITPRLNTIIATLSDGTQIEARLLVAADGRDSFVREALGIRARRWGYAQKALVFSVRHEQPHDNISTEIHRSGGPFTLVPLPDVDGVHHSAVVWMEHGPRAVELNALDTPAFEAELNARSLGMLGKLELASPRALWPIVSQTASSFHGPRTALIAEAAHVVPPIGAQGLNTSLADIAMLRDLVTAARSKNADIGSPELLSTYSRKRHLIVQARIAGIDILNRAAMTGAPFLKDLRRAGLRAIARTAPLKRGLMRLGLG